MTFKNKTLVVVGLLLIAALALAACAAPATPVASGGGDEAPADSGSAQEMTSTLQTVLDRGTLKCGVNTDLFGFGYIDDAGNNAGFDVDFCKAIAAAVLGDATKVEYVSLNADQRFPALQTGEVDVLIRNTTWTLTRDADLGLDFTVTTFYDGQGYMVRDGEFASVDDLAGATICVTSGTRPKPICLTTSPSAAWTSPRRCSARPATPTVHSWKAPATLRLPTRASSPVCAPPATTPNSTSSCPTPSPRSRSAPWCALTTAIGGTL
jgi:ABC-type amino acid transport substrate-binding protein